MENTTFKTSADWIASLPNINWVRPVKLVIDGIGYLNACRYEQACMAPEGCRNPGPYTREVIYVVGMLPKCKIKRNSVCFTLEGDKREWYIAGYAGTTQGVGSYQEKVPPGEYNPFGNNFLLMPWEQAEKIDQYERYTYKRVPMTIIEQTR